MREQPEIFVKSSEFFADANDLQAALQALLVGGLAAAGAYLLAHAFG